MSSLGSIERPLRVAVIGSGPAGFFTVQHLFEAAGLTIECDVFDRLPTPFGLVRLGVAPDHQKIKTVVKVYHKLAADPRFRFFGSVEYGKNVSLTDLRTQYHAIVFTTGAQADRRMDIPGEDLAGSHAATEFVAWYNGHPDYSDWRFDLNHPTVVVVGVGNVAVDVARILAATGEELQTTDIADYTLETLRNSNVKQIYMLGRRGPAQAAFSNPEIAELGELADAEVRTLADELVVDEKSQAAALDDPTLARKLEILRSYAGSGPQVKSRRIILRFLTSPVELISDDEGRVRGVRTVRNELYSDSQGRIRSRPTDEFETIEAGLVLRSVGYKGIPLAELPFLDGRGIVPNDGGRVVDPLTDRALPGIYVSGWIKRGPYGVIGTNKADAKETVANLIADLQDGAFLNPRNAEPESMESLLKERGVRYVSYEEWEDIDRLEMAMGMPGSRPRVKFTSRGEIFEALDALTPPEEPETQTEPRE